jgi:hypothetical protein
MESGASMEQEKPEEQVLQDQTLVLALPVALVNFLHLEIQPHELNAVSKINHDVMDGNMGPNHQSTTF